MQKQEKILRKGVRYHRLEVVPFPLSITALAYLSTHPPSDPWVGQLQTGHLFSSPMVPQLELPEFLMR